jgi:hypothetical protein
MENVEEKIDALLEFRAALDNEDREVFDMLVGCAREIVRQQKRIAMLQVHC